MLDFISYKTLLDELFKRSIAKMTDDELAYFLDLVQDLRDAQERVRMIKFFDRY